MKKWIMTAAIVLASATAANAGWTKCETIRILPGFSIQNCETRNRYERPNLYRNHVYKRGHKNGFQKKFYARNHYRYDRHYYGGSRHPRWNRDIHDRSYRRDRHRW